MAVNVSEQQNVLYMKIYNTTSYQYKKLLMTYPLSARVHDLMTQT